METIKNLLNQLESELSIYRDDVEDNNTLSDLHRAVSIGLSDLGRD